MRTYTVVVADDDPIIRMDMSMILENAGYTVKGEASDGIEAVKMCEQYHPDIILLDIKMPLFDGINAAKEIHGRDLCSCIIMLTAYSDDKFVEQAAEFGVMGYLVKPITQDALLPAVRMAISRAENIDSLEDEIDHQKKITEDRKIIERCKGIIMKEDGITEEEVYKKLQRIAMDKRCTMAEIAELIIKNQQES